ncbi:MAG: hypothetical protein QG577_1894, partial [Thermodesulfobacteriota bacterium]|nr:hypothetical protein [Thermodesulfobacteriota bacterium]
IPGCRIQSGMTKQGPVPISLSHGALVVNEFVQGILSSISVSFRQNYREALDAVEPLAAKTILSRVVA